MLWFFGRVPFGFTYSGVGFGAVPLGRVPFGFTDAGFGDTYTNSKVINQTRGLAEYWYSFNRAFSSSDIGDILEKSLSGIKLEKDDCIRMLRSPDVHLLAMVAGHVTQKLYGYIASFVTRMILNHTIVCITDCKFCASLSSSRTR